MRIAVNARHLLSGQLEGIGWFSYHILKNMVAQHPDTEFVFFFDRAYDPQFVFGPNVTPVVLFPPARHPVLYVWWYEWAVARALKRHKADLFFSPDGIVPLWLSKVPAVGVVHDLAPLHYPAFLSRAFRIYYRFIWPRTIAKARRIAAVSGYTKEDIIRQFGTAPDKISVVHNSCGADFSAQSAATKAEIKARYTDGAEYFVYIGSVHPRKNVSGLLRAFDIFKANTGAPVKLLISGRMAWKTGEVSEVYEAMRFKDDVVFTGYLEAGDISRVMGSALASVYVSLFEGFGIPILEAMHCDVPVICANTTSMPEVAGDAALLVDPLKPEEIAVAMQQLWEDPALREQLIQNGRVQRQKFDWATSASRMWEALMS